MLQSKHLSHLGMFSNFMAHTVLFILLSLLFTPSRSHVEQGFISVDVSNKGLDFVKDLLIQNAVSSLTPLQLPQIEKSLKVPFVGEVHIVLSNITIYRVHVSSSTVKPGDTGIAIVASGATANLSMNWRYSCSTWLFPIGISDKGAATVQVEGMEVGLTLGLKNQQGTLKLSLLEGGCNVKDISIKLDGGASWLYQGVVDAFGGKIGSSVEDAVSKKIKDGIVKLDSLLQSLPKEVAIDDIAALNVTFVNDLGLSNSSIDLEIDGLFTAMDEVVVSNHYHQNLQSSVYFCQGPAKMVGISLHESVLNSASFVYFNADFMHWIVDKIPDQSLMNTAGWRYVVPQLYKQYPNDYMNLNISVFSPPMIKIAQENIDAKVYLDVTIDVLDSGEVIPVACISMVISLSGSARISRNNLAGSVELNDFSMSLKWSEIGKLHMHMIQSVMSTVLKTVFLPYVNLHLRRGFPLPLFHGYRLQNAQILCTDSRIVICSDVASMKQYNLNPLMVC
uniref:Lipid-binding serum glycoprotein C-terminal domain-containing protein n=1 Tax=Davidia involucrata TaxID=16924 RepID=A0A5B7BY55_DAVIN